MRLYEFFNEEETDIEIDEKELVWPKKDSPEHIKVRPPETNYSKTRKKYNHGAKPGARDGFVG
jgi:hypothetical protein